MIGTPTKRLANETSGERRSGDEGLGVSCVQNRQFFAHVLREQLFELKNEDAIKKFENLRDTLAG